MSPPVQLVTPERASTARHAALLVDALRALGEEASLVVVPHAELRVLGRPFGGVASFWFRRMPGGHALDPSVAGRETRLVTVHDLAEEMFPHLFPRSLGSRLNTAFSRRMAKRVPRIVTPSASTKQDIVDRWGVAAERIHVAPWGIDHATFRPQEVAREPGLLVTWSDDQPRKNLLLTVRAMRILRDDGFAVRLERAGGRWDRAEWPRLAKEAGLDVAERGFVQRADLVQMAARAAVFVWPSLHEGFGWPPLEAMACGTPVVALDTRIDREVLGDAAIYHSNEPADAARALREALTSPPPASKMIAHAANFTWARCATAHIRAYRAAGL